MYSTQNTLSVTKSAIAQLVADGYMGETYTLTDLDNAAIVDLGEKLSVVGGVVTNTTAADIFFNALISQISKIVVDTQSYKPQLPSLFVDNTNWGIMSEHIMIDISDVMVDEMWNPDGFVSWNAPNDAGSDEGSRIASIEFGCYKPVINSKLYKKAHGIMVALTTSKDQLFTAFQSLAQYNSFIAGLWNSVENAIALKAEVYALMTVSMGIAKSVANGNKINLLAEYKALHEDSTLEATTALEDADFLKFALMRIAETKSNIQRYTSAYNDHDMIVFASQPNTILLNKFANSCKFNVRANTYHEELLGIGEYDNVATWQAVVSSGTANASNAYNFETASTVSFSQASAVEAGLLPVGTEEDSASVTGIVAVIYDRNAMGITLEKTKVTSQYSASRDTTNYFSHFLENHIVNDHFPIVTFTIEDVESEDEPEVVPDEDN